MSRLSPLIVPLKVSEPDRKAPRFRYKAKGVLNDTLIKQFIKKYPQYKHKTRDELKAIVNLQCKKICQVVASSRNGIELQASLGHIFIGSCKIKNGGAKLNINYKESVKAGVVVLHRNLATDNHIARIWYSNFGNKYKFANRQVWFFSGTRTLTKLVSVEYLKDWQKYVTIDYNTIMNNREKISDSLNKYKYTKIKSTDDSHILDDYNEFDI